MLFEAFCKEIFELKILRGISHLKKKYSIEMYSKLFSTILSSQKCVWIGVVEVIELAIEYHFLLT